MSTSNRAAARVKRRRRVRKKVAGTTGRPRLAVFRSNSHISAQVIDDESGTTLAAASSYEKVVRGANKNTGNVDTASTVGKLVGERASSAGIKSVVFDRGGNRYHGRVAALADAAREQGLEF